MNMGNTQDDEVAHNGSCRPTGYGRDAICVTSLGGRLISGWFLALWTIALAVMLIAGNARAADYVIVVDVSGSMADAVGKKDRRVRVAVVQEALLQYLPALPNGSRVNLLAFNKGAVSDKEIRLSGPTDYAEALAWANELPSHVYPSASTYLWTTLRRALKTASRYSEEKPEQPVTVRVLTDGEDNEGATTLDKVLQEFLPVLDGEKIRSNLVLLGDMEFTTKLSLPEGAFEMTKNPSWEVIFPPIVLWAPTEPKIGEEVHLFENNTRSIYKDYEWQVDGTTVGKDKVLAWRFNDPRNYRVTLKVTGLQGTRNSATVFVRIKDRDKLVVDFGASTSQPEPRQEVRFMGRCSSQGATFAWFVNSNQVATTQDLIYRFDKEGMYDVKLVACDAAGSTGVKVQTIQAKEQALTANIKGPAEIVSGHPVQFASEIAGPCASVEWQFDDGTTSVERNPQHTFLCEDSERKDYTVTLRAVSPLGKVAEAPPHTATVWAEKKAPAPQAAFRILTQNLRAGDPIQLVDETTGPVETVQWDVDGESKGSARNPEFVVGTPGEKTIRMTVRGPGGESVVTKKIVVQNRFAQPVVWCGASKLSGKAPLTVQFTNSVTGDYKSLVWTFGDGKSSTNGNPIHTFATVTNYTVSLSVTPMDPTHPETKKQLTIKVVKPWPAWVKAAAVGVPFLLLLGGVAGAVYQRRRKALRLPVYYFAEQSPVCRTAVLTEAGQTLHLTPSASLRLRREGKSRNLIAEPLADATLLNTDGQEMTAIPVGDGVRVTVRDAAGQTRAVAISTRQKPRRPVPATNEQASIEDASVCGVHNNGGDEPGEQSEFDWEWDKTSTKVG
jgi:PKD repeat protein